MTEERLKEIEARYEERSAALLADKWFWPEEDRLAWDSLAFVTDLVAALRSAQERAEKAEAVVRAAYKLTDMPEYIGETWVDALDALDTALDDYARANQPPQEAI